jgi:flagellar motor switch protein FliG
LKESQLINTLAEGDPDLGADLRQRLFTEEDVLNSEGRFLQNKLQTMDTKEIAVLIKGKNENFRNKIFSNISRTRGDMVLEEESLLTNLTKSESERVTSEFYAALRRAWESGELRISNRDDGEVYV